MLGGKLFHCHLASKWYTFRVSFTMKDEAANKLKVMLGENETGIINDITVSWKNVTTERLDTKRFKAEVPEIYSYYATSSISRRFTIK